MSVLLSHVPHHRHPLRYTSARPTCHRIKGRARCARRLRRPLDPAAERSRPPAIGTRASLRPIPRTPPRAGGAARLPGRSLRLQRLRGPGPSTPLEVECPRNGNARPPPRVGGGRAALRDVPRFPFDHRHGRRAGLAGGRRRTHPAQPPVPTAGACTCRWSADQQAERGSPSRVVAGHRAQRGAQRP